MCVTTLTEVRSDRSRGSGGLQHRSCLKMHRHCKTLQARDQCEHVHVDRIAIHQWPQTARQKVLENFLVWKRMSFGKDDLFLPAASWQTTTLIILLESVVEKQNNIIQI